MKKLILAFGLLASFIFTTGFAAGTACTPGTSNFCACYANDLSNGGIISPRTAIHEMQTFNSAKWGKGIPGACKFGCALQGDTSQQCINDCITDTNYFISNCSFTAANLP